MQKLVYLATEHTSHAGVNYGSIIFNLLAALILFVLLKKFAWDKLLKLLDERQKYVENQLDDAAKNQKEALELLEQNKEKLENAKFEIKEMMEKARIQAKIEKEEILSDTHKQVELLKENAKKDIEDEKKKALDQINKQVAELSVLVASKILEKELKQDAQSDFVDKIIKEVGNK